MTLEEYRNQQHEIDLVVFHGIFKTQNAHGGWNVLPKMFVGRFATGGRCHGWQLEPCPYGLEPLYHFS